MKKSQKQWAAICKRLNAHQRRQMPRMAAAVRPQCRIIKGEIKHYKLEDHYPFGRFAHTV